MRNLARLGVSGITLLVLSNGVVEAQTADRRGSQAPVGLEEAGKDILVTGDRGEGAQDVPASVAVLTADILEATGTTTLDQVAEAVPDLFVTKLSDTRPRLYIRGMGTREYDPGSEASVGVFVDDMYIGRASGVLSSLQDIERVEVLKGPQVTSYGRGTIGGSINIVSKQPTEDLSAEVRSGYGNYGSRDLFGVVSGPLSGGTLLGRVMVYDGRDDGYLTNLTTGHSSQSYHGRGGRARILFRPSATVRIDLTGDISRSDGGSVDAKNRGSPSDPHGTFFSASTLGLSGAAKPIQADDRFADFYNRDSVLQRRSGSLIGRVAYDTPLGTVTGVGTYRRTRLFETRDFDASSLDAVALTIAERSRQSTQELRFTSDPQGPLSFGSRLRWMAGIFRYRDRTDRSDRFDFGPASVSALRTGSPQADDFRGHFETTSWAMYGEATIDLSRRLSLTMALRRDEDHRELVQTDLASWPGAGFIVANFTTPVVVREDKAWTPTAALSFRVSDAVLAYADYRRGYKGGGFQYIPTNVAAAMTTFRPERSNAFEMGAKTRFWRDAGTFNVSAFYYDDRGLQVQRSTTLVDGSIAIVTNNADRGTMYGIDVDASLRPFRGVSLQAAYSYLEARFDRYFNNQPGQPLTPATDYSGTPIMRSPKHSVVVSADYEIPIGVNRFIHPRISWTHRSRFFFESGGGDPRYGAAIPMTRQDGYGLVDVSLAASIDGLLLRAHFENVLDRYYLSDVQKLPFNYVLDYPGRPRTYGLSAIYNF